MATPSPFPKLPGRRLRAALRTRTWRIQETLRTSEERLRFALEGANDGLWDVQLATNDVYMSPRGCQILGYLPHELPEIARVWSDLVHPDDVPAAQARLGDYLAGKTALFEVEQRLRTKDGGWKWVLARGKVVARDAQGNPLRMTGTHTDIDERIRLRREALRMETELAHTRKLDSLGALAAGIAHDMNNVLGAVFGIAETLKFTHAQDAPMVQALDSVLLAARRGRDLVRTLTDFSHKGLEKPQPVDLNELISQEMDLLGHTLRQKVQIQVHAEARRPRIIGEPGALGNLLLNLAINARDAMPAGGVITLRTCDSGPGQVELRVEDTGTGMAPEVLARALEPFFTTKPKGKGTGLGLALAYSTVKAHGGTLDIFSQEQKGTQVRMRFPTIPPGPDDPAAPVAEAVPARSLEILLVDDDDLIHSSVPPMLKLLGHRVHMASSAPEAIQRLEAGLRADLAILDHNMPGMSGAEALPRILALRPDLAVVIATGFQDAELTQVLADWPRVHCLKKPFSLGDLRRVLGGVHSPG